MSNSRKPHSKEQSFSPSWAFKSLRDRTLQTYTAGGRTIRVITEPMLARPGRFPALEDADSNAVVGGPAQPIRIQATFPITTARIGVNGRWFVSRAEAHSQGVRVYFPEIDEATTIRLVLPEAPEFGEIVVAVRPVRKWQVHLVHHSHLDIGYTDPQPRVLREQVSFLDTALEHVEDSASGPRDRQFKWVVESLHTFQLWEKHRPGRTINRFIDQVRLGNIELTAAPYNMATETASTPELYELFRYTQEVRTRYGLELPVAMQTDVPGVVAGFVDALADNNVKYLSVAHNWAGRSAPHLRDAEEMPQLFWLRAHNGGRVLTWMTDSGHGLAYQEGSYIGFSQSYDMVDDLFPLYMSSLEVNPWPFDENAFGFGLSKPSWTRDPYPHDIVHFRVQGRLADNAPANRRISETVADWNGKWAYPQLLMSTNEAFFNEAEATLGDALPEFGGDWHNWWADGAGSSARGMQLVRQAQNKLTQIETLATLLPERPGAEVEKSVRDAWNGIALFDEHTWGAADPWTWGDEGRNSQEDQWHWKFSKVQQAEQEVLLLEDDIAIRLAEQLGHPDDCDASIWAVNTQAHPRGGQVTVFLPESVCSLETVVELSDPRSSEKVPHREIPQTNPYHREAGRWLVFRVVDVPGLGFERIRVTKADRVDIRAPYFAEVPDYDVPHSPGVVMASAIDSAVLSADGRAAMIENEHLRVSLDIAQGAISEILLKAEARNLVDSESAFGFNAYVYDNYATASKINHMSGHSLVLDDELSLLSSRIVNQGAFDIEFGSDGLGQWLSYRTRCGDNEVTTRLELAVGSAVLQVTNRIKKPATFEKEAGFFAFPFAIDRPAVRSEVSGSVIGTDIEQVPGSVHYMHAIRHWISLSSGTESATLVVVDAPLVQIGDIALPYLPFPPTLAKPEPSTVFSWVHNNQWDTNYPLQQGLDMEFRYAVSGATVASTDEASIQAAATASPIVQPIRGVLATPIAAGPGHNLQRPTTMTIDHEGVRLIDRTWIGDRRMLCRFQSVINEPVTAGVHCAGAERIVAASMLGSPYQEVSASAGSFELSVPALGTVAVLVTLTRQ
jgi:Glycosyl hydrolases family 38 N-terminal domain